MPTGGFNASLVTPSRVELEARIMPYVIITCIITASGGLMFGYDIGILGGVTSMNDFLEKFFPTVYHNKNEIKDNDPYCKYDNQGLQLFTSSLYLIGLIATFFASYMTKAFGKRPVMLFAGLFFLFGVILVGGDINFSTNPSFFHHP